MKEWAEIRVCVNKIQIKLLSENQFTICAFGNLHYQISRENFELEPELEPRAPG